MTEFVSKNAVPDGGGVVFADGPIAVMDGTCALCSFAARMIHRMDPGGQIRIAPIQGQAGAALMVGQGLDPLDPESWLLIREDGTVWRDMEAVIALGRRMGGWGHVLSGLKLLPRPLRSWIYRRIARNRYGLFGRAELCALPDPAFQRRLLP